MNDLSLKEYIDSNKNLFLIKESKSYPGLHVLKYKRKVFHDNLWNKYFEQCRGTIVDSNFNRSLAVGHEWRRTRGTQ